MATKPGTVKVTLRTSSSNSAYGNVGTVTWRLQGYPSGKPWTYQFSLNGTVGKTATINISAPPGKYALQMVRKSCCPYCKIEGGPINPTVKSGKATQIAYTLYKCAPWYPCCSK